MRDQVLRIIGALKRDQPDDVPDPDDRTLMAHRLERVLDQLEAGNWASAEACLYQCARTVSDSWPHQYAPGSDILVVRQAVTRLRERDTR